jgi:6,7-dimethyl-8-ribityllumazine synthase
MHEEHPISVSAAGVRVAMAVSRYHRDVTDALREGAARVFVDAGGSGNDLSVHEVPGAFELPVLCLALAGRADFDAVIALGCILRGETMHDQFLAQAVTNGLTQISIETGKPIGLGLLTCQTMHQARERAGGSHGNKGAEAMAAALEMVHALRELEMKRERV